MSEMKREKLISLLLPEMDEEQNNKVHVIEITPIGIMGRYKSYESVVKDINTAKEVAYIEGLPGKHNICVKTDIETYYCASVE